MFPNEASNLYDWTSTSKLSYGDFLQAKQFERSIRFAIDDQTKRLVASNEQLLDRGIAHLDEDMVNGFSIVSADIRNVENAIQQGMAEIVGTLEWGFGAILGRLDRVNEALTELIRLAKTPSQTWAYEQFEIARDEYRRGLYPEALESVTRAIAGHGSNLGYKTEFRFHYLLGTIRLGSWLGTHPNVSPTIVDLEAAESAFLTAARYSEADFPSDAGKSFICAGRAAFLQRATTRAIEFTDKGLSLRSNDARGEYQLARCYCAQNSDENARPHLLNAIMLRPELAVEASGDQEFLLYREMLERVIRSATRQYENRYQLARNQASEVIANAARFQYDGLSLGGLVPDGLEDCNVILANSDALQGKNNLFGAFDAYKNVATVLPAIDALFPKFRERFGQKLEEKIAQMRLPADDLNYGFIAVVLVLAILLWLWGYSFLRYNIIANAIFEALIIGIAALAVLGGGTSILAGLRQARANSIARAQNSIRLRITEVRHLPMPNFWGNKEV